MPNFCETCIFQVKPAKVDEFERLMNEAVKFLGEQEGSINVKLMKRTHRIASFESIKEGIPPKKLTRIIKSVKYIMYWELKNEIAHGIATQKFFEKYNKDISKLLIMPADKFLGIDILT